MWIYLVINVVLATTIFLLFKWFRIKEIDSRKAIFLNYCTVAVLGMVNLEGSTGLLTDLPAVISTMITGLLFITVFNIMALTSQQSGITIASIASKMSVIIPVIAGIILYRESAGILKITGIMLAIAAIIRVSWRGKDGGTAGQDLRILILPGLLFIGSGVVDSMIKYMQHAYLSTHTLNSLLTLCSMFAGIAGLLSLLFTKGISGIRMNGKVVFYGVLLGIVNYGALYSLLKVLDDKTIESGVAFSMINVSVVSLSAILARTVFNERLSSGQLSGLVIALAAILILNLS